MFKAWVCSTLEAEKRNAFSLYYAMFFFFLYGVVGI